MYRSQLMLDLSDRSTVYALKNCHDMHRNLMKAFADELPDNPRQSQSLLYTLMNVSGKPAIYVVSATKPDWSKVKGVQWFQGQEPRCIDAIKETLKEGQQYHFRLLASPTKKVAREGKLSARVFLRDVNERALWLHKKAERSGFQVSSMQEKNQEHIRGKKKEHDIHYTAVVFEGILSITDVEAFWTAYSQGIGSGKAYGMGMLMIKRC